MSRKRIHELAKEWEVQTKSLLVKLEQLGINGKKALSALTDEEAKSVKQALGLMQEPVVPSGQERVMSERLATGRDEASEQVVITKEKVVENRVRTDVVHRRNPVSAEGAVLRAEGISKTYSRRTVLQSVTIEVKGGEVVGLLGPNGAAKAGTL